MKEKGGTREKKNTGKKERRKREREEKEGKRENVRIARNGSLMGDCSAPTIPVPRSREWGRSREYEKD
jgi:hypothetical protein